MRKKLIKIFTIAISITIISSISVIASSNKEVKEKIQEFNKKLSTFQKNNFIHRYFF